jgi:hypothetical protein
VDFAVIPDYDHFSRSVMAGIRSSAKIKQYIINLNFDLATCIPDRCAQNVML